MNKQEFLNKLKSKISILKDNEIEDILNEYAGYIDEKVNDGKTEKEAVKELGNVNEIANDLLDAYKLKNTDSDSQNIIEKGVKWIADFVDIIVSNLKDKSFSEILKFLLSIAVIFLVIVICKIPFIIIENAGVGILKRFTNIGGFLSFIWTTIIEFCYLFIAIIAFVTIVKKEFFKETIESSKISNDKTKKSNNIEKKESSIRQDNKPRGFITNCIIIFLKFICFWMLIGVFGYLVGISMTFALSIYLYISTFKFIGIPILMLGLLLIGIAFASIGFNFIVNRKIRWKKTFISIIISLVLLGSGIGLISISIANTTFKRVLKTDTKEVVYKLDKDMVIEDLDKEKIIINDKESDIRIVYKYNKDFVKIPKPSNNHFRIEDYSYSNNNKKVVKYILNGLKKDVIYYVDDDMVDYQIYVNKDTLKILNNNYDKWQKSLNNN